MQIEEFKKQIKKKASKNPEKHYPTETLKEKGYRRQRCEKCGEYFWAVKERETCDEPECTEGYSFINNPPGNQKDIDYIKAWKSFEKHMEKRGYTSIKRYPVIARWKEDSYWTNASIYDFQPHVVTGEVEPPANPLIVPQMCMRFNDTDNVGITGRHNTSFVMTGQHAFKKPDEFDQKKYFKDYFTWFTNTLKIPKKELTIHEDQWGGGGNLGVSLEIFSRSLELGNQVYMNYKIKEDSYEPLDIQVLDMGMGHARVPWLLTGKHTIYQVEFPTVCEHLFKKTGIKETQKYREFLSYSGTMDMEEVQNVEKKWEEIAEKINTDKEELKKQVTQISNLYSIGDHLRTLLFAITDGALPSNTSGGYDLRTLYRRIHDYKDKHGWDIDFMKIAEKHAEYLEPMFPETQQHLEELNEILNHEEKKYKKTLKESKKYIEKAVEKEDLTPEEIVDLYDTKGISPETLKQEAKKRGKKIEIPSDLYARIAEKHSEKEQKEQKPRLKVDTSNYPNTETLYHEENLEFKGTFKFKAKVLGNEKINGSNYIILDRTAFYPESGGQEPDHGKINGLEVDDVQKKEGVILHKTSGEIEKGKKVKGKIDKKRREDLTKHHTATHIINGAARKTLGEHVWQAGAKKYKDRARIDITHYEIPSEEQIKEIEKKANRAIEKEIKIEKKIMNKREAEEKHGFRIYQGGYVPGNKVRIVNIKDWDVEACGGTHCNNTSQVGAIKITNVSKKQDGVIRMEYKAGEKLRQLLEEKEQKLDEIAEAVQSDQNKVVEKVKKMKKEWKQREKKIQELRKKIAQGGTQKKSERIRYMEDADMKLLQEIADKEIKQNPDKYIILVTKGKILGKKGEKCKTNIKKAVEKGSKIMGGSAGGSDTEIKGGGPKIHKAKEAYEEIKKLMEE